jgi:hypothetical protein
LYDTSFYVLVKRMFYFVGKIYNLHGTKCCKIPAYSFRGVNKKKNGGSKNRKRECMERKLCSVQKADAVGWGNERGS